MNRKIVLAAVVSVIAAYTAFWCDDGSDWDINCCCGAD